MNTPASTRTHSIWKDTRAIVSMAQTRAPHATRAEQPKPAASTRAEREADRWVAEMMFDHYNG